MPLPCPGRGSACRRNAVTASVTGCSASTVLDQAGRSPLRFGLECENESRNRFTVRAVPGSHRRRRRSAGAATSFASAARPDVAGWAALAPLGATHQCEGLVRVRGRVCLRTPNPEPFGSLAYQQSVPEGSRSPRRAADTVRGATDPRLVTDGGRAGGHRRFSLGWDANQLRSARAPADHSQERLHRDSVAGSPDVTGGRFAPSSGRASRVSAPCQSRSTSVF